MLAPFSEIATALPRGIYEHYKGNQYEVLGVGRHSETHEEMVIYRGLYGSHELWIRPLILFVDEVSWEGKMVPRFRHILVKDNADHCCHTE